jgi:pimeloyl-ACP methyl ester carboxylesterase
MADLEVKHIKVDDLQIEYLQGGSGEPLVLLHGFGADKDNWTRIARHLVDEFNVIAIDLPGFGNSTQSMELDYDVQSQVARLKQITTALGLKTFNLAGSSMGGYIAGNFAAQYPDLVENLWLISPLGVERAQPSEMFTAMQQGHNPMVLPRNNAEFNALFDFLFVDVPFVPSSIVNHLATQASERIEIKTKIFNQLHVMKNGLPRLEQPLDTTLADYTGSVLVLWGEEDRVLHVSGATVLAQSIPNAELDIMPNIGHLPMLEAPVESAESFIAFAEQSN